MRFFVQALCFLFRNSESCSAILDFRPSPWRPAKVQNPKLIPLPNTSRPTLAAACRTLSSPMVFTHAELIATSRKPHTMPLTSPESVVAQLRSKAITLASVTGRSCQTRNLDTPLMLQRLEDQNENKATCIIGSAEHYSWPCPTVKLTTQAPTLQASPPQGGWPAQCRPRASRLLTTRPTRAPIAITCGDRCRMPVSRYRSGARNNLGPKRF